ncbi:helix-turn-helix domain-containing protein [Corynebacterium parakroppenstedtii]|uniref:helix-turn-helix domain-containing protein n=1 Tax=Corynebacterium parakroppenstedtii TaxID=2828363 RepID=UPI001C8F4F12|nr:helix-turn-helix domain-containing protein [Corynebacterium parakroppenstedtii]MBY0795020.1 helix-turn-helix domain-containing protein [Corynebacterium parakroppenstedtii]
MSQIFQGPGPEDDFTLIPNSISRSTELPTRAKAVYIFMRSHRDGWNITTTSVAHALGMNKDTVAKAINDLIESGHMRRIEKRAESGRFAGWDYEVLSGYFPVSEEFGSGDLAGSGKPASGNSGRIRRLYSKKTKEITSLSQEDHAQTSGSSERESRSDRFDEFWDAYPRKVGKDRARKAFASACRRATPEEIIEGAKRLAADPNLPKRDDPDWRYVKHPTTWLNGGCWQDGEPLPSRAPSRQVPQRKSEAEQWDDVRRELRQQREVRNQATIVDGEVLDQQEIEQ